jgi:hypothetical protein
MKRTLALAGCLALVPLVGLAQPASAAAEPLDLELGVVKNLDIGFAGRLVFANSLPDGLKIQSVTTIGPTRVRTIAELGPGDGTAAQNILGQTWVAYAAPPEIGEEPPSGPNVYYVSPHGEVKPVFSTWEYQAGDPDPYDTEGFPSDSNPYDVEVLLDGSALIADAAGDDLLRVWKNGTVKTVACFPTEFLTTDHLPFPPGPDDPETPDVDESQWPPVIPAEAVPTGVAVGTDGMAYVSELKGFPFKPGASKVWKVNPNKFNQGCNGSVDNPVAPGQVAASGFSGINDVSIGLDRSLYVTELHRDGVLAAEGGFEDPASIAGQGRLTKVKNGVKTEIAAGELTFPGSAVKSLTGQIYVANTWLFGASILKVS